MRKAPAIDDITSEDDLRHWLAHQILIRNEKNVMKIKLTWIEPAFGSTIGAPDAQIDYAGQSFGFELKHFHRLTRGVFYKIRPVQRRYHVMGFRGGKKLLIMATIANENSNELVLIRGDNVPLRDYCDIKGSGCQKGIKQTEVPLTAYPLDGVMDIVTNYIWWK